MINRKIEKLYDYQYFFSKMTQQICRLLACDPPQWESLYNTHSLPYHVQITNLMSHRALRHLRSLAGPSHEPLECAERSMSARFAVKLRALNADPRSFPRRLIITPKKVIGIEFPREILQLWNWNQWRTCDLCPIDLWNWEKKTIVLR